MSGCVGIAPYLATMNYKWHTGTLGCGCPSAATQPMVLVENMRVSAGSHGGATVFTAVVGCVSRWASQVLSGGRVPYEWMDTKQMVHRRRNPPGAQVCCFELRSGLLFWLLSSKRMCTVLCLFVCVVLYFFIVLLLHSTR